MVIYVSYELHRHTKESYQLKFQPPPFSNNKRPLRMCHYIFRGTESINIAE